MRKLLFVFCLLSMILVSCGRVKNKAKEAISESGEMLGKGAAEFFESVADGASEILEVKTEIDSLLIKEGVNVKYISIERGAKCNKNEMALYCVFEADFKGEVACKAFSEAGREIGRLTVNIEGEKGEGKYIECVFDEHTHIEAQGMVKIDKI